MKSKDKSLFNPQVYLESVGISRKIGEFRKKQTIFAQGDPANTVIYIQKGSVKFTVVNESGKEAVVAIFGSGDFFGEGAMEPSLFGWAPRLRLSLRLYSSLERRK